MWRRAGVTSFFLKFACGSDEGKFIGVNDPAWGFPAEFIDTEAELLDEDDVVVGGERDDMNPVRGFEHKEVTGFSGGVLHVFLIDVEDAAWSDAFF